MSIYKNAKKIISINRDTLWVILVYSTGIAILSLAIPISVQSLINVVSFGTLLQPVIVLTIVLFVILMIIAGIRIAQAIVVETIQQRLFVKLGITLAQLLPNITMRTYNDNSVSQYANYFFEVQTIQKALATLLVIGIEVSLLAFFSMLLVAFYHPLLLLFDIVLIVCLFLALRLPWKRALEYSILECDAKHDFAYWLEEILKNIILFKMQDNNKYAVDVADNKLVEYLNARKNHFGSVLKHIIGINVIYVLANAALLGIGGYLVIQEQLSLGQLVASELIINAMLYGVVRFSFYMEDLYDLLASSVKIGVLLDIPQEKQSATQERIKDVNDSALAKPPSIDVDNLNYVDVAGNKLFDSFSMHLKSGDHVVLCGKKNTGKSLIVDGLLGLRQFDIGVVRINDVPIQDYNISDVRQYVAIVREVEIFSGSIYDNLVLHRRDVSKGQIYELIRAFELEHAIEMLPDGLDTFLSPGQINMTRNDLIKLMFVRAMLMRPKLLLIDGILDYMVQSDLPAVNKYLSQYAGTMVITTQSESIAKYYDRQIYL